MRALHSYFSRWQNWLGLFLVLIFVAVAVAAPVLSPDDPENPGIEKIVGRATDFVPHPPSQTAILGTLPGQISVFHALVWGTRSALIFGLVVVLFAAFFGTLIGTISAYFGGFINNLLMRITDTFLTFPLIAGVVLIQQLSSILLYNAGVRYYTTLQNLFTRNLFHSEVLPDNLPHWLLLLHQADPVLIAFILFSWMPYARIMNTVVTRIKNVDYIQAARAMGAGHGKIIFRHLIPNSITPVIVLAAKDIGGIVLLQATFTFIGMGSDSPWGMLLVRGRDWIISAGGIFTYWWVFVPATVALVLFGIAWNLIGDGLNDALNPRSN